MFCLYPINVKTAEPIGPKFCVQSALILFLIFASFKTLK